MKDVLSTHELFNRLWSFSMDRNTNLVMTTKHGDQGNYTGYIHITIGEHTYYALGFNATCLLDALLFFERKMPREF